MLQPQHHSTSAPEAATVAYPWSLATLPLDALERDIVESVAYGERLGDAAAHHFSGRGKRLRGRLAIAVGLALDAPEDRLLPTASAIELLHNASLVHAALQDADRYRRGTPSIWAEFDKPTALLLGDALIASAFGSLGRSNSRHLGAATATLARCVTGLAAGQCADGTGTPLERTVDGYERLARAKTGLLFALAGELPWIQHGGDALGRVALRDSLALVGVAFQIFDDLADVFGHKGRAVGSDLRCGRFSAAVLHHDLAQSRAPHPRPADAGQRPGVPVEVLAEEIRMGPGVPLAQQHMRAVLDEAAEVAGSLPKPVRQAVLGIAQDVEAMTTNMVGSTAPAAERRHSFR